MGLTKNHAMRIDVRIGRAQCTVPIEVLHQKVFYAPKSICSKVKTKTHKQL